MTRPGMADSRCFTDYSSNCEVNNNLKNTNKINNNGQYRDFLQKNSDQIRLNMQLSCQNSKTKYCDLCKKK